MMDGIEQLGKFTLRQSDECFKLGRDSVLLSRFASLKKGQRVCDLGCGVGSLLLLLSEREEQLERVGVEISPHAAALATRNLSDNGLSGQIHCCDLRTDGLLTADQFHLVISNPPYFEEGTGFSGGSARMDEQGGIAELCAVAARLLRTRGRFALVFRPERLPALFAALAAVRLAPKRLQLLAYSPVHPPYAVLLEAVKEGGAQLDILPTHYQEDEAPIGEPRRKGAC